MGNHDSVQSIVNEIKTLRAYGMEDSEICITLSDDGVSERFISLALVRSNNN